MNGAENITDVARTVRPPLAHHNSLSSSDAPEPEEANPDSETNGALMGADRALNQVLARSGFVDITAPFMTNFAVYLDYYPAQEQSEDLDSGVLSDLIAFLRIRLCAAPGEAEQAQARVPAEAAMKLLA